MPKKEINILGKRKIVQPICECEADEMDRSFTEIQNRKHEKETRELFSISDMGEKLAESSFDNFIRRTGTEKMFSNSQSYVEYFDEWGEDSLLIWGTPGNGKSRMAAAVANAVHENGKNIVFQSVPELLQRIRSTFGKQGGETEADIMKALLTCDLLILDDIGAEKLTDWVQDIMYRIIDGRYRKKKPILYTSNIEPKQLANQLGGRTYDRILETSLIIENQATSYRREVAKERMKKYVD